MRKALLGLLLVVGCGGVDAVGTGEWQSYSADKYGGAVIAEFEVDGHKTVTVETRATEGHPLENFSVTLFQWGLEPDHWTPVCTMDVGDNDGTFTDSCTVSAGKFGLAAVAPQVAEGPVYFDLRYWLN
jgi:hypothetical protein